MVGVAAAATLAGLIAPVDRTHLDPLGYAVPLVGALSLLARRRVPNVVVVVTTVCVAVYYDLGYPGYGASLPLIVALYTAVLAGHRRIALVPLAGLLVGTVTRVVTGSPLRESSQSAFLLAGWLVAAVAMGAGHRQWRAYVRQLEKRALDAERTREEAARRRAAEERLHIARELHDSLTHSISVITMQAGVAVHLANKRGEPVPEALTAIQAAGRDANRELRATLGVLRAESDDPVTGVDALPELVARSATAGMPATLTRSGTPVALPAAVDRAAYRIVQEALTNAGRHSGAAAATVEVRHLPDALVVEVCDDGGATPDSPPVPGIGLLGMRERVTALGGTLDAAPRPEGGFRVRAELPLRVTA
ncbi:histidine kinase [Actinocatenispora rupis]|uniref:histidine kinase n=1 Tax=Actinocatenispora rupis TaxID=519421 RepID=A0A8J3NC47_9ACTN|nr:two-component sensor histidine kinase [Actinocatenispora rupis]